MNAIELMVGDFVMQKHSGLILQVSGINPPYITAVGEGGQFHEDTIKPILLTKEILEKNNFLKVIWQGRRCTTITTYAIGEGFNLEEDNDGFNLVDNCSDSGDYGYESNYICDIKYIHELQHVLKLFEIEKTIEL